MDLPLVRSRLSSAISPPSEHGGRKPAAVLVVIHGAEPHVVMTEKPASLRVHAGEISFPGGKPEDGDADLLHTALRETREEIGLDVPRGAVTGQMGPVVTLNSGFVITPFVAVLDCIPGLAANEEVERIFEVPLGPLLRTEAADTDPDHHAIQEMSVFTFGDRTVWGASARILGQAAAALGVRGPAAERPSGEQSRDFAGFI
ncbi:NTP pyrophosphohydrolase [Cenarchaeum symbiosum A]|uniref:NTP pyrophosphohydrolase n=1 Tax=Cenarchaeum symbiosum (strain A) TaxID=414004 RepID=A0RW52_CENSY|nr:NTP pyrophosphohydrolase [Cenarchaeum symbiosum A]